MGPKKGRRGPVPEAALKQGHAFRRQRAPGRQLPLVPDLRTAADKKAVQGSALRRRRPDEYAALYHETHDAPKSAWDSQGVPLGGRNTTSIASRT